MQWFIVTTLVVSLALPAYAGISKLIQEEYRQRYENQTIFLAVPIYGKRQQLSLRQGSFRLVSSNDNPLRFKVGEQVRVLKLDFGSNNIRFKVGSIDMVREGELEFRFPLELDDGFSARQTFETALKQALNQSQNFASIDKSKEDFIRHQLDDVVNELRSSTDADSNFVLKSLAESLPAYREAVAQNRTLQERNRDLTLKMATEQDKSKHLDSRVVEQTSEINRLKRINQSQKTDLEALNTSSSSTNTELREMKQENSRIVTSVKRLQRGLGAKGDPNAPLSKQIADLMVASLKTKGDRDTIAKHLVEKRTELDDTEQQLEQEQKNNTQLRRQNTQLRRNVNVLSSRGDSLGKRFLILQEEKIQLESFVEAVRKLNARWVGEITEGGRTHRTMELRLNETLVGTLETGYPKI